MTRHHLQSLVLIALLLLSACRNELELNAPYKEIPSVYAVLNPQDSMQVIRINKVFLGNGDANVMAQVADSVNYRKGDLSVYLTRTQYGQKVMASVESDTLFFKEDVITTSPGAFNTTQRVYVTTETLHTTGDYQLTVRNRITGNVFTAKATVLPPVAEEQGIIPFTTPFYHEYTPATAQAHYIDYSAPPPISFTIRFRPVCTGACKDCPLIPCADRLYQLVTRVHFYDSTGSGNRNDYVDYTFASKLESKKEYFQNTQFMAYSFNRNEFFTGMGIELSKKNLSNNIIGRKVFMIEYLVYTTTDEYAEYLKYNSPSFGINQQVPVYSNFENRAAIGIFTFRSRRSVKKRPATTMVNEFSRNSNTCGFRFLGTDGTLLGCR